jgi:hypothetical protein
MDLGILGSFLLLATLISYAVHLTGFLGVNVPSPNSIDKAAFRHLPCANLRPLESAMLNVLERMQDLLQFSSPMLLVIY